MLVSEAIEYLISKEEEEGQKALSFKFDYREMKDDWENDVRTLQKDYNWKELGITNADGRLQHIKTEYKETWDDLQKKRRARDDAKLAHKIAGRWFEFLMAVLTENGDKELDKRWENRIKGVVE